MLTKYPSVFYIGHSNPPRICFETHILFYWEHYLFLPQMRTNMLIILESHGPQRSHVPLCCQPKNAPLTSFHCSFLFVLPILICIVLPIRDIHTRTSRTRPEASEN